MGNYVTVTDPALIPAVLGRANLPKPMAYNFFIKVGWDWNEQDK